MKTLIINLGPSGDVLRTTVMLNVLSPDVYWVTKSSYKDVLSSKKIRKVFFIDNVEDVETLKNMQFDWVINLNEEKEALGLVSGLNYGKFTGIKLTEKGLEYTSDSSYWFDMSLSSKFGKKIADEKKFANLKSYPQIMVEMLGKKWEGEEYDLGVKGKDVKGRIGIINVETGKWPNKLWAGYDKLEEKLKKEGFEVVELGMRPSISDHIDDINNCELVVCGDTLGMHIALALKKKVIALFTCTSHEEIYDYERLVKIISPLYKKYFYQKEFSRELVESIPVEEVLSAVKKSLKRV